MTLSLYSYNPSINNLRDKGTMDQKPIQQHIESRIFLIRGQNVMLDADLAGLYGVDVRVIEGRCLPWRERRNWGSSPKSVSKVSP